MPATMQRQKKKMNEENKHGCAIVMGTHGIIITGQSQSGKSSLAHALIQFAKNANLFACWIGDDQIEMKQCNNRVIAKPLIKGKAEKFGYGIENIKFLEAGIVDLVVELKEKNKIERMPETKIINDIPHIQVPEKNNNVAIPIILATLNFSLASQ